MRFEQAMRTHVGSRRKNNEDAFLARPEIGIWAVADGMGGHAAGALASATVAERLGAAAPGADLPSREKAARAAIEDANRVLFDMARGSASTIGSTVVALVTSGERFCCLWAGDSRAYQLRGGMLHQLTRDHSLVQQLVDSGDLAPEVAASHPNSNIITRAVGSAPRLELDQVEGDLRVGDVFLLASDGLTRLMGDDELMSAASTDLEALAEEWVKTALARGAPDNLTFILLRAGAEP